MHTACYLLGPVVPLLSCSSPAEEWICAQGKLAHSRHLHTSLQQHPCCPCEQSHLSYPAAGRAQALRMFSGLARPRANPWGGFSSKARAVEGKWGTLPSSGVSCPKASGSDNQSRGEGKGQQKLPFCLAVTQTVRTKTGGRVKQA